MRYQWRYLFFFFGLIPPANFAFAELAVSTTQPIRIEYKSKAWNRNPKLVEHGWLAIENLENNQVFTIELTETDDNSSTFVGYIQLDNAESQQISIDVYVLPDKSVLRNDSQSRILTMIEEGSLAKKNIRLMNQGGKSLQVLGVFDTADAAIADLQDNRSNPPLVDRAALEAQLREKDKLAKVKLLSMAAIQEAERVKLEVAQKAKIEALKLAQQQMAESERKRRKEQAIKAAKDGNEFFKKGKFVEAEREYVKATELDPDNKTFLFQYGVAQYRLNKFNPSIVSLKAAESSDFNPNERDYFLALNYSKLGDNDNAIETFLQIKNKMDKNISPSAAFFAGTLQFKKEQYDLAKANFEFVLDHSSDPTLDKQAESFIDQIAAVLFFKAQKGKTFIVNFNWGLTYDSNILNEANAQAQTSLNGFRAVYGGSLEFRPIYTAHNEFSIVAALNDTYSWNASFQPNKQFQQTDPLIFDLSAPFKYKGKWLGKSYILTLTPAAENLYMDVDATKSGIGPREMIISSAILKAENMFVISDDYFASYNLEVRHDNSLMATANDGDDLTANKVTLSTAQLHFKNKKKTEASIYDGSLALNQAKGSNQKYQRIDAGASYMLPVGEKGTLSGRAGLFYAKYPDNNLSRADNGILLSGGFRKPITETWAMVTNFSYMQNNSNVASDAYNKYSINLGMSYSGGF